MQNLRSESHPSRSVWFVILIAIILMAGSIGNRVWNLPTPLERIDLYLLDTVLSLRSFREPVAPIVIVAIDDDSFNYTGYHWPWPRMYLAEIVDVLNKDGAKIIGFDIFLFENDLDMAGDQALADAFAESQQAVGLMNITRSGSRETLQIPIEPFPGVFDSVGMAGIIADNDAIIRSIQSYDRSDYDGKVYFNWAFEVTRLYLGIEPPQQFAPDHIFFNNQKVPLQRGRFIVDFIGPPETFPYYSAYQVALGDYPAGTFRDKIVLIGSTTLTLQDLYPVPTATRNRMPGVEITANSIHTLLTGRFRQVAPPIVDLLILIGCGVVSWLLSRNRQPVPAIIFMGVGIVLFAVVWGLLLIVARVQISLVSPELMILGGSAVPTISKLINQEFEKRRIQKLFGHFVAPEIISQLLKTPDVLSLNKRANLSILFSDIRNFTSLSEKLSPDEVVGLLNPYLQAMTEVVHKHGGTVDKYIGDAIVAFYGEPVSFTDHAKRAVRTALDMRTALEDLRQKWLMEGRYKDTFEIGIGIHTGDVFVGMIGSQQRLNYTIIGDAVNTASRLQDQTKFHNYPILISQQILDLVADEFVTEFVEERAFKGKTEPVRMYKLLGYKPGFERPEK